MEYQSNLPATTSPKIPTAWIEGLALDELNMEESGVVNFNDHLNPLHDLEESSIRFVDTLRDHFEYCIDRFNEFRGNKEIGSQIKIFKISGTVNDFMLFRNSLRLIVGRKADDLVTVGFLSNKGGLYPSRIQENQLPHEIRAHVGPFNKITWRFLNEVVDPEALVRHYLTEFIRKSSR